MALNPMGKTRPVENPYLTIKGRGGWRWRVLKAWSTKPDAPMARWFCAVDSPFTQGSYDMGDVYVSEIDGEVTQRDPSVPDEALPLHLR